MLIISYLPYLLLRRLDHSDGKHPRKIHILAYLNTSFLYLFVRLLSRLFFKNGYILPSFYLFSCFFDYLFK